MSFKSNLDTESTKDSVTMRFLSRHETMLCRSNFFALFIEEPIYHRTLALMYGSKDFPVEFNRNILMLTLRFN